MTNLFWCKTHLEELSIEKRSPDSRYCQDCYDFLLREAELLSKGKPDWMPDPAKYPVCKRAVSTRGLGQCCPYVIR